jgi:hypothetical protein
MSGDNPLRAMDAMRLSKGMKWLGMAAACGLTTLALASCGGGADEGAAPTETQGDVATEATTATTTSGETTTKPTEESVEEFVLRVNDYLNKGQWGRAYEELHPAQRDFMSSGELANCMDDYSGASAPDAETKVTEVYDEPWQIPGTKVTEDSKAVTVKIFLTYSEEGEEIESELGTFTQHAFMMEDGWVWIVSQDVVDDLKDDFC